MYKSTEADLSKKVQFIMALCDMDITGNPH
jgi:hypothetical protein